MDPIRMVWSLPDPPQGVPEALPDRIYNDYFDLSGTPFSITPDPEFLYFSETHQGVMEKIRYGIESRLGFLLLTGEVGTGKTTLCRAMLDRLQNRARTVYVINPSLNGRELLACILEDLGVVCHPEASKKELIDSLNRFLLAQRHAEPVVIIIDDAQTMPPETLEDMRLLSNLETDKTKLLQLLLVGQPELVDQLNGSGLRQLKQRVALHCLLDFLSPDETAGYIARRLSVAGNKGQVRFDPKAVRRIHKYSGGVPRMINKICDLALTAAYTVDSRTVQPRHVTAAFEELVEATSRRSGARRWFPGWRLTRRRLALTIALLIGLAALLGYGVYADWTRNGGSVRMASAPGQLPPAPAKSRPSL